MNKKLVTTALLASLTGSLFAAVARAEVKTQITGSFLGYLSEDTQTELKAGSSHAAPLWSSTKPFLGKYKEKGEAVDIDRAVIGHKSGTQTRTAGGLPGDYNFLQITFTTDSGASFGIKPYADGHARVFGDYAYDDPTVNVALHMEHQFGGGLFSNDADGKVLNRDVYAKALLKPYNVFVKGGFSAFFDTGYKGFSTPYGDDFYYLKRDDSDVKSNSFADLFVYTPSQRTPGVEVGFDNGTYKASLIASAGLSESTEGTATTASATGDIKTQAIGLHFGGTVAGLGFDGQVTHYNHRLDLTRDNLVNPVAKKASTNVIALGLDYNVALNETSNVKPFLNAQYIQDKVNVHKAVAPEVKINTMRYSFGVESTLADKHTFSVVYGGFSTKAPVGLKLEGGGNVLNGYIDTATVNSAAVKGKKNTLSGMGVHLDYAYTIYKKDTVRVFTGAYGEMVQVSVKDAKGADGANLGKLQNSQTTVGTFVGATL